MSISNLTRSLILLLLIAAPVAAQSPIIVGPNSSLVWSVAVPDVPTAQGLTYNVTVGTGTPKALTGVTCVASGTTGVQTCSCNVSEIPLGSNSITLTSASGTIVSAPSAPFAYVTLLIPIPTGVSVKP